MHRKLIGALHLTLGFLTAVPVLALTFLFGGVWGLVAWATKGHEASTVLGIGLATLLVFLVGSVVAAALVSLVAGVGVLMGQKWGDVLASAISVFHLFNFPVGTAIAAYTVYGLWFAEPAPQRAAPVPYASP